MGLCARVCYRQLLSVHFGFITCIRVFAGAPPRSANGNSWVRVGLASDQSVVLLFFSHRYDNEQIDHRPPPTSHRVRSHSCRTLAFAYACQASFTRDPAWHGAARRRRRVHTKSGAVRHTVPCRAVTCRIRCERTSWSRDCDDTIIFDIFAHLSD